MKLEDLFPAFADTEKMQELAKIKQEFEESYNKLIKFSEENCLPINTDIKELEIYYPKSLFNYIDNYNKRAEKLKSFDGQTFDAAFYDLDYNEIYANHLHYLKSCINVGICGWVNSSSFC